MESTAFFSVYLLFCLQVALYGLGIFTAVQVLRYIRAKKAHDQQVLQELQEIRRSLRKDSSN